MRGKIFLSCKEALVEFQALLSDGSQLIIANHGCPSLPAQSLRKLSILYDAVQYLGHLSRVFRFHQEAVYTIRDDILAAAHACDHARQATRHSF